MSAPATGNSSLLANGEFARYERAVQAFIRRQVANRETALDLAQEVWQRILRVKNPARIANPLSYIFRTAIRVIADYRAGVANDKSVALELDEVDAATYASEQLSHDPTFEAVCSVETLQKALDQLPPHFAEILTLRRVHGLSYSTIAEVVDYSVETTKQYFFEAQKALLKLVQDLEGLPPRQP